MARKKKQTNEPPPENLDNTDDTFGLPEVDYQPLKRGEPENEEEPAREPVPEPPVEQTPEVVIINETPQIEPESDPAAAEPPSFEFKENLHMKTCTIKTTLQSARYEDIHQPYTPRMLPGDSSSAWPKF